MISWGGCPPAKEKDMSIIIYTCPECGHDLIEERTATYPSNRIKKCAFCGWKSEEQEAIIRIPYDEKNPILNKIDFSSNPCEKCNSHPRNGGTGICHCILGNPTMY